jgi:hypothetical protein
MCLQTKKKKKKKKKANLFLEMDIFSILGYCVNQMFHGSGDMKLNTGQVICPRNDRG